LNLDKFRFPNVRFWLIGLGLRPNCYLLLRLIAIRSRSNVLRSRRNAVRNFLQLKIQSLFKVAQLLEEKAIEKSLCHSRSPISNALSRKKGEAEWQRTQFKAKRELIHAAKAASRKRGSGDGNEHIAGQGLFHWVLLSMTNFHLRTLRPCIAAVITFAASTALLAQSQDEVSVDAVLSQAQATLRQIDSRVTAAAAWDNASPLMRSALEKEAFLARIENDRKDVGPIAGRAWQSITRTVNAETNTERVPAGNYISINSMAQGASGQLMRELISFRLEEDRKWRMTGYVAQKVTSK
jgi:hypothetical protein